MLKLFATACAALAMSAFVAMPSNATEQRADGVRNATDQIEVSAQRRHRRHVYRSYGPRYAHRYYGPRYRYRYARAYHYAPYYAYAPRPYYRSYYGPGVGLGVGPFGFGFRF